MNAATFRPTIESLETRLTPATTWVAGGDIQINGTSGRDIIEVRFHNMTYYVNEFANGASKTIATFTTRQVTGGDVIFLGHAGNDKFVNSTGLRAQADGGAGDDELWGGVKDDLLVGGIGKDELMGMAGNDRLYGGDERDELYGGDGRDYLSGGQDGYKDYLSGGGETDTFVVERVWNGQKYVNRDQPDGYESWDKFVLPK